MSDDNGNIVPIMNTILTFRMSCMVNVTSRKLVESVDVINNNFSGDEIKDSKRILCDKFEEAFNRRKTTNIYEKEAHASDIVEIMKQLDSNDKINMSTLA